MAQLEPEAIPARLKAARKDAGLTQEAVSEILRVHKRTIENDEHGASGGLWERLNDYSRIYNVPVERLMWGEQAELVNNSDALAQDITGLRGEVSEIRDLLLESLGRKASRQAS